MKVRAAGEWRHASTATTSPPDSSLAAACHYGSCRAAAWTATRPTPGRASNSIISSSNPFGRLLGRLSVGRKLALIYLLDLTAVIYVSSILINEKFIGIDFARKELAGNT